MSIQGADEEFEPRPERLRSEESKPRWTVATGSGPGGTHAFRPGRVILRRSEWLGREPDSRADLTALLGEGVTEDLSRPTVVVLDGVTEVESALALLRGEGLVARPDHLFFAVPWTAGVSSAPVMFGGVGGAPVTFGGVGGAPVTFGGVGGAPVTFGGVGGAPVTFGGVGGAPVTFGGVGGAPVTFGGVGGAPVTFGGVLGVPVTFGGFLGVPVTFGGSGSGWTCCCGRPELPANLAAPRRSTALKAVEPAEADAVDQAAVARLLAGGAPPGRCRVVVVDTGFADDRFRPSAFDVDEVEGDLDVPDANLDRSLDSASGHATFIAGIVRRLAPEATVEVHQVLSTFGDASDQEVADVLTSVATSVTKGDPTIVNLSFAGYSDDDTAPPAVAAALAMLQAKGVVVVAAAGNDATCRPAWPAATPGVIGVGAIDDDGPAWFTNHGPWVQACAPGVDVVSRFFDYTNGKKPAGDSDHPQQPDGNGWATWSGTSFAAPIVAGVLAKAIGDGAEPADAVRAIVDDPALFRLHGLGTVVNARPW